MVNSSKTSIESELKEFSDLFSKDVKTLDTFCDKITKKVNVMIGPTAKLIKDITSFNKGYIDEMKLNKVEDGRLFDKINKCLTRFQDTLLKFDFTSTNSISQEQISSMVSSVELFFKSELPKVLDLVLYLPTNAPHLITNVS